MSLSASTAERGVHHAPDTLRAPRSASRQLCDGAVSSKSRRAPTTLANERARPTAQIQIEARAPLSGTSGSTAGQSRVLEHHEMAVLRGGEHRGRRDCRQRRARGPSAGRARLSDMPRRFLSRRAPLCSLRRGWASVMKKLSLDDASARGSLVGTRTLVERLERSESGRSRLSLSSPSCCR